MQFIDLEAINARSRTQIDKAIATVCKHGRYINGPEVYGLEERLSRHLDGAQALLVASGTMALEVALRALEIGPGDEVITTPFTWISTAEAVALVGAKPVFADIEAETFNIDPKAVEAQITERTKAIIAVNLFGQMADYETLERIAKQHGLYIIEDGAQSFGAERNGKKSGTSGDFSCTSFFPAKPLGGFGDGGAVFTKDSSLAEKARAIANHGCKERESHYILGTNGRCDTLQAAIIDAKLDNFLDDEVVRRERIGTNYTERLKEFVRTPSVAEGNRHVYAQYTVRLQNRDAVATSLREKGVPTAVYYRKCLHQQKVFEQFDSSRHACPVAEKASREVLSLPFHPYLTDEEIEQVCDTLIGAAEVLRK